MKTEIPKTQGLPVSQDCATKLFGMSRRYAHVVNLVPVWYPQIRRQVYRSYVLVCLGFRRLRVKAPGLWELCFSWHSGFVRICLFVFLDFGASGAQG